MYFKTVEYDVVVPKIISKRKKNYEVFIGGTKLDVLKSTNNELSEWNRQRNLLKH